MRTTKTANNVTIAYYYDDGTLVAERRTTDSAFLAWFKSLCAREKVKHLLCSYRQTKRFQTARFVK